MEISYNEQGLGPRVDWGDALAVHNFYGREKELALLSQWIVQEDCRVVSVLGMGGIGKSALTVSLIYQLSVGTVRGSCPFEVVIFRSLRDAPSCEALLDDCLQVLSLQSLGQAQEGGAVGTVPCACPAGRSGEQAQGTDPTEQRISLLLEHLRKTRALLVLDNLESLLQEGNVQGHLRPGFEGYGLLLHRLVETVHQSCLLLTSREKPAELRLLEGRYSSVHSLRLAGLDVAACQQFFMEKDIVGTKPEQESLIKIYAGNPLALKIVAETIVDLFEGKISQFLAGGTVIFGSITDLLDKQFARLSALERTVLYWLAIVRESVTFNELLAHLVPPLSRVRVLLEAIDGLRRRSLIESGKRPGSFTLQSVVLEYVTMVLIAEASTEIQQGRLDRLIQYSLEQATAREYVRQAQERLLISPLLADLQSVYRRRVDGAGQAQAGRDEGWGQAPSLHPLRVPTASVEAQLLCLLDQLRKKADNAQGYGSANLIALLRLQRGHLKALDLSKLSIRGAYLQSIEMQDANLSGSRISDCIFTEAVNATGAVAISLDGKLWAAGGIQGKVRVWDERGQTLYLIHAHTDIVQTLAFSPDGRTLASGSLDGTVKMWDVGTGLAPVHNPTGGRAHGTGPHGTLLWTGLQKVPILLAFSPDSSLLASGGLDATVRLWDPQSGKNLQTLEHPSGVFAVTWSPDGCLLASGCFDGVTRLWEKQKTTINAQILSMQASWVTSPATGLAFAPDGRTLASANWDRTVKLWEVGSLRLLHTLPEQTNHVHRVAWSPDGRILASYSHDTAILLWDVEQGRYRAALREHTADITSIAFTPDSGRLLSGSTDSTLRVWDVETGQCVRVIAGYATSLYALDWSPDGTHLASGGTDGLVTIWNLSGKIPPRVLHGHSWVVYGVGWSPDGRFLASSGWGRVVRLWDPTSGACVQKFEYPEVVLLGMAWSRDGKLLAHGTYQQGVQVWDVTSRSLRWVGGPHLTFFRVAWSPDGTRLTSGCDDGSVYLWDGADGTLLLRLLGHDSRVNSVEWSPDGMRLASSSGISGIGDIFVWNIQSGERVQTFGGHCSVVYALAWSPSGDLLISGGSDGILRWWDVQSGECVSMRTAHQGTIQSLGVSPDGKWLASCGDDGAVTIWDLERSEHLRMLRRERPYERLNITGIRGLNEAQKEMLQALGAIEEIARCSSEQTP